MRIVLIGADNEENLGVAMIAASLISARHQVRVVGFTEYGQLDQAVSETLRYRPHVVGLAMQFQHRGWEFTALAEQLRDRGFRGHLVAGGQLATMAYASLLADTPSIDSVVLFDGERTIVDLVEAIGRCRPIAEVPGLAVRLDDGCVRRTEARQLPPDLDALPQAWRYRAATRHFGVPFLPISGGRGCWGKCGFCSITSYYRAAKSSAGGASLRLRSPASIALEMAELTAREQSPCIFCFHDETLLLPRPIDTQKRLREITAEAARLGVEGYGLVGKCRPDCLTEELVKELADQHVIRLYVGIENASQAGQDHLARRTRTEQLDRALRLVNQVGIFSCYNLLIFEPDTTIGDVRENIEFIRNHASNPVNFCRAEPYHGTPLWQQLKASGELEGSWLGWDYHLRDPNAELLFRLTSVVFRQRNFDTFGVANRSMSLGYMEQVMRRFYPGSPQRLARISERAAELTQAITLDSARFLEECVELVQRHGIEERELVEREAVRIGMHLAARDAEFHVQIDRLIEDAERIVADQRAEHRFQVPVRLIEALTGLALAGCVAGSTPGCGGSVGDPAPGGGGGIQGTEGGFTATDPVPQSGGRTATSAATGGMIYDPVPYSGGRSATTTLGQGGTDPVPNSGGRGGTNTGGSTTRTGYGGMVSDALPSTGGRASGGTGGYATYDPVPSGGGRVGNGGATGRGGAIASGGGIASGGIVDDPVPNPGGRSYGGSTGKGGSGGHIDSVPNSGGRSYGGSTGKGGATGYAGIGARTGDAGNAGALASNDVSVGHFRDTRVRRTVRRDQLALYDPPDVTLQATRARDHIHVTIVGLVEPANTRWASRGKLDGQGLSVRWIPGSKDDQLRVAIRTKGGVTIAALRARDVPA
jgi:anaerobic magnesium-protoporphyrin IX monomethyl ester cyclase